MRPHKVRAGTTGYLIAPPPPYAEGWEVQFPNDDAMPYDANAKNPRDEWNMRSYGNPF